MTDKSNQECEEAIRKFSEITKCDEALSHCVLQDVDYDLDQALATFFANQQCTKDSDESTEDAEDLSAEMKQECVERLPEELTFLSWNIDGIDTVNLQKRFVAVLHVIAKTNPEVIFLQEVVGDIMPKLMNVLSQMYHIFISDHNFPYFCVTLVSKNIRIIKDDSISFDNSAMGRGFIVVEAEWKSLKLKLINTHLESMADYSEERKQQFALCLAKLEALRRNSGDSKTFAIFAGDLNIRDSEVPLLPAHVKDAWIEGGMKQETRYTWDMTKNDNKKIGRVRLRFDRVYYSGPFQRVNFSLAGMQRIRNINCFPSDHFAVICCFHGMTSN